MSDAFLYIWINEITEKKYIGVHKGDQNDGYICSSKILKECYWAAPQNFKRTIISIGSYDNMLNQETILLHKIDAKNNPMYYNMHNGDGNFVNKKHTEQTKVKMSLAAKGKPKSKEHIKNLALARTGVKLGPCSEERKKKISIANTGKKRSKEFCDYISRIKKGKPIKNRKSAPPLTIEQRITRSEQTKAYWKRKKGL